MRPLRPLGQSVNCSHVSPFKIEAREMQIKRLKPNCWPTETHCSSNRTGALSRLARGPASLLQHTEFDEAPRGQRALDLESNFSAGRTQCLPPCTWTTSGYHLHRSRQVSCTIAASTRFFLACWDRGRVDTCMLRCRDRGRVEATCMLRWWSCPCVFHARGRRHCVRAAKELDSKSNGLCPQGLESPRCRIL